jgi:hypothetical protein
LLNVFKIIKISWFTACKYMALPYQFNNRKYQ